MDRKQLRAINFSNQNQRNRFDEQSLIARIGSRDRITGRYEVIFPNGQRTKNGIKLFDASVPEGTPVKATLAPNGQSFFLDYLNVEFDDLIADGDRFLALGQSTETPIGDLCFFWRETGDTDTYNVVQGIPPYSFTIDPNTLPDPDWSYINGTSVEIRWTAGTFDKFPIILTGSFAVNNLSASPSSSASPASATITNGFPLIQGDYTDWVDIGLTGLQLAAPNGSSSPQFFSAGFIAFTAPSPYSIFDRSFSFLGNNYNVQITLQLVDPTTSEVYEAQTGDPLDYLLKIFDSTGFLEQHIIETSTIDSFTAQCPSL